MLLLTFFTHFLFLFLLSTSILIKQGYTLTRQISHTQVNLFQMNKIIKILYLHRHNFRKLA